MTRFPLTRRVAVVYATIALLVVSSLAGAAYVYHSANAAPPPYVTLPKSYLGAPTNARLLGPHAATGQMEVQLVLSPRNGAQLDSLFNALYDPSNAQYHQWLAKGQFNARFAPGVSQVTLLDHYLTQQGLHIVHSPSPFFVRAVGTTSAVEAAFRTHVSDYQAANGTRFYANDRAVQVPANFASLVQGVSGLSSTVREQSHYITTQSAAKAAGKAVPKYGDGPGGSGLSPQQTESLYNATPLYSSSNGAGQNTVLAVFELSGYTRSDVVAYEQQFFGGDVNVPMTDVNVDGGPINPVCPTGDQCGPFDGGPCANGCDSADYSGDIEVEADLEMQISIAPFAKGILVYNAPNDFLGITTTDEYAAIANDDFADSISSSWGLCEQDAGYGQAQAEAVLFYQMAVQGQSMFSAAGDTGAYDCLRDTGSPNQNAVAVDDPSAQRLVTAVGGTSFGSFDPGSNDSPTYPTGFETVWNVLDACSGSAYGLTQCANLGAGGGGNSIFWAQPIPQWGPGVISSYTQDGPYCIRAQVGKPCRELPDVSANADEYTPYAEYCTGNPATNSTCALFSASLTPPGWFGIGGTSLSSPLWSGIIALWDSYNGERFGAGYIGLYRMFRHSGAYSNLFHDITGINQTENNNGLYPVTPNYDMATGIGTPDITAIAVTWP